MTLTLSDGVRAVLYMGMDGQVDLTGDLAGFRCPPHLWPAAQAVMSGIQEKKTPPF